MRFPLIRFTSDFGIKLFLAGAILIALQPQALFAAPNSPQISGVEKIFALHTFPEPLVHCGRQSPTAGENDVLLKAIASFEARIKPDDCSALEGFLAANPRPPWHIPVPGHPRCSLSLSGFFPLYLTTSDKAFEPPMAVNRRPLQSL